MAVTNEWVNENGSVWLVSKANLVKYITHLHLKVSPQTIISYLSALNHHHVMNQMEWKEVRYDPLIKQLLKTIEGNHIFAPSQQKEHVTREHLRHIRKNLNITGSDDLLFWVVSLVAFYGLARLGELLPRSQ